MVLQLALVTDQDLRGLTRGGEHPLDPSHRGIFGHSALRLHPEREQFLGPACLRRVRPRYLLGTREREGEDPL